MSARYLDDMRNDGAPDVRVLRSSTHTARKPWVCAGCWEGQPAGTRYEQIVLVEDGRFRIDKLHPNGCPKLMAMMAEGEPPAWADAGSPGIPDGGPPS